MLIWKWFLFCRKPSLSATRNSLRYVRFLSSKIYYSFPFKLSAVILRNIVIKMRALNVCYSVINWGGMARNLNSSKN